MRRRKLLALLGWVAMCPRTTWGVGKIFRVGVLTPGESQWRRTDLVAALNAAGYIEGRNLALDIRSADGRLDRLDMLAAELVRTGPDAILAVNTPGVTAAIKATRSIPIVMGIVGDPVGLGFVSSLARPGGNMTGVSNMSRDLSARRMQLLKEAVPSATRIALLMHPDEPIAILELEILGAVAPALGLEVRSYRARDESDLEKAFQSAAAWRADAMFRISGQASMLAGPTITLAATHRLPVMHLQRSHVIDGGLMSYFPDEADLWKRIGTYVARILNGEKPGDLPVIQPERFTFVINLKTARALGLSIPVSLLAFADEVID